MNKLAFTIFSVDFHIINLASCEKGKEKERESGGWLQWPHNKVHLLSDHPSMKWTSDLRPAPTAAAVFLLPDAQRPLCENSHAPFSQSYTNSYWRRHTEKCVISLPFPLCFKSQPINCSFLRRSEPLMVRNAPSSLSRSLAVREWNLMKIIRNFLLTEVTTRVLKLKLQDAFTKNYHCHVVQQDNLQ